APGRKEFCREQDSAVASEASLAPAQSSLSQSNPPCRNSRLSVAKRRRLCDRNDSSVATENDLPQIGEDLHLRKRIWRNTSEHCGKSLNRATRKFDASRCPTLWRDVDFSRCISILNCDGTSSSGAMSF